MKVSVVYLTLLFIVACQHGNNRSGRNNISVQTTEVETLSSEVNIISPTPETQLQNHGRNEIIHGVGGAKLRIGDTRSRTLETLGDPSEEYDLGGQRCDYVEMHWIDIKHGGDGIYAFFREGKVNQLRFSSSLYRTPEGIGLYSSPVEVRNVYKKRKRLHELQEYILENSAQQYNGSEDLIFWVDQNQGIAFEFYFDRNQRKRLLWSIEIFEPNTPFLPDTCVLYPKKFTKIGNVSLE